MINLKKTGLIKSLGAVALASLMAFASVISVAAGVGGVQYANAPIQMKSVEDLIGINGKPFRSCEITVEKDGKTTELTVMSGTVADCLETAGVTVGKGQIVCPSAETPVKGDMTVRVVDAKKIKLTADGETKDVMLPLGRLGDSLKLAGIEVGADDILSEKVNVSVDSIKKLTIQRVTYKTEYVTKKVKFKIVKETSDKVELGETKVKTKGKNGEKVVAMRVKYVDGKKKSSKKVAETVTKKAVDEVVLVGTKGAAKAGGAGTFSDSNGVEVSYKYVLTGSGTAYTAPAGALTATGVPAYHGGVAIDPTLIPYGSKLYVESVDGGLVYGYCTAVDTGGFADDGSGIIDVFYDTYDECVNWGRRDVNVYVIE